MTSIVTGMTKLDDVRLVPIPIISLVCKLYECYIISTKNVILSHQVCWKDYLHNQSCLNHSPLMHLSPIVVVELLLPEATEMLLLTDLIDFLDLFRCQLERCDPQIITQPLFL